MNKTQTNDFLVTQNLGRLMRKYTIPCIVSLLVAALSIAMMIGDGCCTFVSISLGAKENDNAHRGIGSSVLSVVAIGIILMAVFLLFQEQILTMFGARVNEETFRLSKEYFFWITLGVPFYMFGQAMNPIIRSDGSPGFAMVTLLTGAILNIIFDPICIFVFKWGMMGAAVTTIFGQIVAAVMSLIYLFKMKAVKISRDSFFFRPNLMKRILPLGITSFLSQISIVLSMAAVRCIRIFLCLLMLSCVNKGTFIFLQSLGKAKESTLLSIMREIVFGVGLPLLLPVFWGLDGILYFMPAADILTFFASAAVIIHTKKMLTRSEPEYPGDSADTEPAFSHTEPLKSWRTRRKEKL